MAAETAPQVTVDSIVERFRTPTPRPATPRTPDDANPLPASDDVQASLGRVRDRYEIPYSGTRVPAVGPEPDVVLGLAEGASDAEMPNAERPEPIRANFRDRVREGLHNFFLDPYRWLGRAGGVAYVEGVKFVVTLNSGPEAGLFAAYISGLSGTVVGTALERINKRAENPRLRQLAFGFAEGSIATAAAEAAIAGLTAAGVTPDIVQTVITNKPPVVVPPGAGGGNGGSGSQEISIIVKQGQTLSQLTKDTLHLTSQQTYAHLPHVIVENADVLRNYASNHGKTEIVDAIDWVVKNPTASLHIRENWDKVMLAGRLIHEGMPLKFQ